MKAQRFQQSHIIQNTDNLRSGHFSWGAQKKTVIQQGFVNGYYAEWKKDEHMENEYENYTGV